jgi:hypothetical protein
MEGTNVSTPEGGNGTPLHPKTGFLKDYNIPKLKVSTVANSSPAKPVKLVELPGIYHRVQKKVSAMSAKSGEPSSKLSKHLGSSEQQWNEPAAKKLKASTSVRHRTLERPCGDLQQKKKVVQVLEFDFLKNTVDNEKMKPKNKMEGKKLDKKKEAKKPSKKKEEKKPEDKKISDKKKEVKKPKKKKEEKDESAEKKEEKKDDKEHKMGDNKNEEKKKKKKKKKKKPEKNRHTEKYPDNTTEKSEFCFKLCYLLISKGSFSSE